MIKDKDHIKSVIKAFKILDIIGKHPQIGVSEIARQSGLKKTTVARILKTLQHVSVISQNSLRKGYILGKASIEFGSKIWTNLDIFKSYYPLIRNFVEVENISVLFSILNDINVVYIDKYPSNEPFQISTKIGEIRPAYCCAAGKIMLSFLDPKRQKAVLNKIDLEPNTDNTITNLDDLEKELRLSRKRGFSVDLEESTSGICSVAAPIFDHHGEIEAAISAPRMSSSISKSQLLELGERLSKVASRITYGP
jgi:DNA-binding IclR family transcriptional regulator